MNKEFYNNLFKTGYNYYWQEAPGKLVLLNFLKEIVKPNFSILDIGCGDGYFLNSISELFSHQKPTFEIGVDISEEAINLATKKYSSLNFKVMDVEKLKFDDAYFDISTSYGVFEHINDPAKAISEMSRVLKKNGSFAALIPTIGSYRSDRLDEGWYEDLNDPPQLQWNFKRNKWESYFTNAGLTLLSPEKLSQFGAKNAENFYFGFKY